MSSNPDRVELGVRSTFVPSRTWTTNIFISGRVGHLEGSFVTLMYHITGCKNRMGVPCAEAEHWGLLYAWGSHSTGTLHLRCILPYAHQREIQTEVSKKCNIFTSMYIPYINQLWVPCLLCTERIKKGVEGILTFYLSQGFSREICKDCPWMDVGCSDDEWYGGIKLYL